MPMLRESIFMLTLACAAQVVAAAEPSLSVAPAVQQQRDNARKQILESELVSEKSLLASAKEAYAQGLARKEVTAKLSELSDKVTIHEQNIAAISREINLAKNAPVTRIATRSNKRAEIEPKAQRGAWLISPAQRSATPEREALQATASQTQPGKPLPKWIVKSASP